MRRSQVVECAFDLVAAVRIFGGGTVDPDRGAARVQLVGRYQGPMWVRDISDDVRSIFGNFIVSLSVPPARMALRKSANAPVDG